MTVHRYWSVSNR